MSETAPVPVPTPEARAQAALADIQAALKAHRCDVWIEAVPTRVADGSILVRPTWRVVPLD